MGLRAQLWDCSKGSNIETIQISQNMTLKMMVDAPWFVRNTDLHQHQKVKTAKKTQFSHIFSYPPKYEKRLRGYENVEAIQLHDNAEMKRRLKLFELDDDLRGSSAERLTSRMFCYCAKGKLSVNLLGLIIVVNK